MRNLRGVKTELPRQRKLRAARRPVALVARALFRSDMAHAGKAARRHSCWNLRPTASPGTSSCSTCRGVICCNVHPEPPPPHMPHAVVHLHKGGDEGSKQRVLAVLAVHAALWGSPGWTLRGDGSPELRRRPEDARGSLVLGLELLSSAFSAFRRVAGVSPRKALSRCDPSGPEARSCRQELELRHVAAFRPHLNVSTCVLSGSFVGHNLARARARIGRSHRALQGMFSMIEIKAKFSGQRIGLVSS